MKVVWRNLREVLNTTLAKLVVALLAALGAAAGVDIPQ